MNSFEELTDDLFKYQFLGLRQYPTPQQQNSHDKTQRQNHPRHNHLTTPLPDISQNPSYLSILLIFKID